MVQEEDKGEVDGLTIMFWDPFCSAIFLFTDLYAVNLLVVLIGLQRAHLLKLYSPIFTIDLILLLIY